MKFTIQPIMMQGAYCAACPLCSKDIYSLTLRGWETAVLRHMNKLHGGRAN